MFTFFNVLSKPPKTKHNFLSPLPSPPKSINQINQPTHQLNQIKTINQPPSATTTTTTTTNQSKHKTIWNKSIHTTKNDDDDDLTNNRG